MRESFTDVILRKFTKDKSGDLLNYVKAMEIDRETLILASNVEEVWQWDTCYQAVPSVRINTVKLK